MSDSAAAAQSLARQIQEYWLRQGYVVSTRVVKLDHKEDKLIRGKIHDRAIWCIKTDMRDGYPTQRALGYKVSLEVSGGAAPPTLRKPL